MPSEYLIIYNLKKEGQHCLSGAKQMRILIINEFAVMGGAEVQTFREWEYFLKKGHEAYVLTFDPNFPSVLNGNKLNVPIHFNKLNKIKTRLFGNRAYYIIILQLVTKIAPDIVHINNIFNLPKEVFNCVKDIPTVQTIRDFGFWSVCPNGVCVKENGEACTGYMLNNCRACMRLSPEGLIRIWSLRHYNDLKRKTDK